MNDERLGLAAGALLRDHDRPAPDPRGSIKNVMAQVRVTPQGSRLRWWPSLRGKSSPTPDRETAGPQGHPTHVTQGRTQRSARAEAGGTRTMLGPTKLFVVGVSVALVSVFVASGVLRLAGPEVPGAASPGAPSIGWTTERVALAADDFRLEVNDLVFGDDVWPEVRSDPGDLDRWTLEVEWTERDVEQRLNMYFGSDGSDWWVREMRTYDGHEPGEWVYAYGPFFTTPLGEAFEGDVTIELLGEGRPDDPDAVIPGVLSFSGMRLAVSPGTAPTPSSVEVSPEESPPAVDDSKGSADTSTDAIDEPCSDEEYPAADDASLCRALFVAMGDSDKSDACLTVEEATAVAEGVADAGCVFYVGSGAEADGTPVYYLHRG